MIAKNLIRISLVAFVLALAAQPAFSATLFVDAAAPPGGNVQARPMIAAGLRSKLPKGQV
jgi:hypothetical protein